jgi:hypothetical protein
MDQIQVGPFVETPYVVGFSRLALVKDQVNGPGMVHYIKPVTGVLTIPVNGKRLVVPYIVYKKWDQLLGKLVRPVIVGAVAYDERNPKSIAIGTDKMI